MSIQRAASRGDLETMSDAFAARSMGYLGASDYRLLLEWPSLGGGDAGAWNATRSGRLQGIAPYRIPYSC